MTKRLLFFIVASQLLTISASSYTTGDGDSGCTGGCGSIIEKYPNIDKSIAIKLLNKFTLMEANELNFLKSLDDDLCKHTDCMGLEIKIARQFVSLASNEQQFARTIAIAAKSNEIAAQSKEIAASNAETAKWGLMISALSLLVASVAFLNSWRVGRRPKASAAVIRTKIDPQ